VFFFLSSNLLPAMKQLSYLSAFLLLLCASPQLRAQCFELVWSDEFATNGPPDPATWGYDLGTGQGGWGNQEIQTYTSNAQNMRVADGKLVIEAHKVNNVWTSARIKSQGKKSFTYGKVQFRAKLPQGAGTWPALWLLGDDITSEGWPACGEIDVMEHVGKDPGRVHGSLHTPSSSGATVNTGTTNIADFASNFHDYEVLWTADAIAFKVDGNTYYTYQPALQNPNNWPFNNGFFLIMNIAMGGVFGSADQYETGGLQNGVEPGLTTARMEVDYVRVFQEIQSVAVGGAQNVTPFATGLTYTLSNLREGTFNWTVPAGAVITAGQGTPTITVNWGSSSGEVAVTAVGSCNTYTASLAVNTVAVPQAGSYILDDFEDSNHDRWIANAGTGNSFTFTENDGALSIAYAITAPGAIPTAVLQLEQLVDLSTHSKMRVRAKTFNTSGTVSMRIDLFDQQGTATNASPVFKLEPLQDDGQYAIYEHDFSGDWQSSAPNIGALTDSSRIAGLNLYINYGLFGAAGSDELWLDYIEMVDPQVVNGLSEVLAAAGLEVYPNPAQHSLTLRTTTVPEQWPTVACQLYNQQGVTLSSQSWTNPSVPLAFDVQNFPAGIYFLSLKAGSTVVTKKVILK
jgi:beta-glucanase (GH16 family)